MKTRDAEREEEGCRRLKKRIVGDAKKIVLGRDEEKFWR